jgi:hypothetical protein
LRCGRSTVPRTTRHRATRHRTTRHTAALVTDPPRARHIRVNPASHTGGPVKLSYLCHGERVEDALMAHMELERGAPFCGNPACALHVRLLDESVEGGGNWLTLPDGRMFGRSRIGNMLLCDACATHRGPVRLDGSPLTQRKRAN